MNINDNPILSGIMILSKTYFLNILKPTQLFIFKMQLKNLSVIITANINCLYEATRCFANIQNYAFTGFVQSALQF